MKTQRFLAITAMAATMGVAITTLTSCGEKDKEPTPTAKVPARYVGTYDIVLYATGDNNAPLNGTDTISTLKVEISSDSTYCIASTSFNVSGFNIAVSNLKLQEILVASQTQVGFRIPKCEDVKVNGSAVGYVEGAVLPEYPGNYHGGFSVVPQNSSIETIQFKASGAVMNGTINVTINVKGTKQQTT